MRVIESKKPIGWSPRPDVDTFVQVVEEIEKGHSQEFWADMRVKDSAYPIFQRGRA